jgi:hypothetical protein
VSDFVGFIDEAVVKTSVLRLSITPFLFVRSARSRLTWQKARSTV